jgi:type VI secretion system protein ImpL
MRVFKDLKLAAWLQILLTVTGVILLSALIWFAGPLIEILDIRPLGGFGARIACIFFVLAIVVFVAAYHIYRRRADAAKLEQAVLNLGRRQSDAAALQDSMKDALATLRRAKGAGPDYLYQIPWYMIIGKPRSGKTTALINSGLKFPLNAGGVPAPVAGSGSTLYCDWWFTEEAVLIDTAGRYTTQDEDAENDAAGWLHFLELLKTNRPRQPINGVLVAISLQDLVTMDKPGLLSYAASIRKRLLELHQTLEVDFPIYVLLTKADLVAGFREAFAGLDEIQRRMVWGATFRADDAGKGTIADAPAEFDLLVERLNAHLADRMQMEPNPAARVRLFGLPTQLAALKRPIIDFLNLIFEPTRFHANAIVRGFYFTSGTQIGTPFDQLISSISAGLPPAQADRASYSNLGKSYFITDLLEKVIIPEAGWVSTNRRAVRRDNLVRAAAVTSLLVLSLVITLLWYFSYRRNSQLLAETEAAISEYRIAAEPVLRQPVVADRDFAKILPLLDKLRYLPVGYGSENLPGPISAGWGLSQIDRLRSSSENLYQLGLERMLRPRLIFRMEERIEANRNNPAFLYEALKVYMMLGGQVKPDRDLIRGWVHRDWSENLFPGSANASGRRALEDHLTAMLDLEGAPVVSLNGPLVEDCQRTLSRLSVVDRAFEILRSQASAANARDWSAARAAGPDSTLVFDSAGGQDLDTVRVPYFYTYDGFQHAFIDKLRSVGEQVTRDQWVLGTFGEQTAIQSENLNLYGDLTKLYNKAYVEAWRNALSKLKLRALTADKPRFIALAAAAAPTSPIGQILESIRDETELTHERGGPAAANGSNGTNGTRVAAILAELNAKAAARIPLGKTAQPEEIRTTTASDEVPGAAIEASFRAFQIMVEGEGGRRRIDALLQTLSDITQTLQIAAANPLQAAQANVTLAPQVASLRNIAAAFPQPFADMMRGAADEFEGDISRASAAQLKQALNDQVTRVCEQIITARYPFVRSSDRDVAMGDFGRLFSPNGVIDQFFQHSLAAYVDQSRPVWSWRADARVVKGFSTAPLADFQRAAKIRDAFFAAGGMLPSVALTITPITLSGDANSAKFEIGGGSVESQRGVNTPGSVIWPGGGAERTAITLNMGFFSRPLSTERRGPWSLFRMLDSASVLAQGDKAIVSFVVEGKGVSYEFSAGATANPLILLALRDFKCPAGF